MENMVINEIFNIDLKIKGNFHSGEIEKFANYGGKIEKKMYFQYFSVEK